VWIILDDQQHRLARFQGFAIVHQILGAHGRHDDRMQAGLRDRCRRRAGRSVRFGSRSRISQRQKQREGTATARNAAQTDLAPEQVRQLARDRQPQARAAVLTRRTGIRLLERLEDDALLLGRDADAGVAH
jgi:hypothetical protein